MGAVDTPTDLAREVRDSEVPDTTVASRLEQRLERLPSGHPSALDYADRRGPADQVLPFTDLEHAEHVADVRARLSDAHAAGLSTDRCYTLDEKRKVWTAERDALHDSLVGDLYAAADAVPCEGKAIIAGGTGGAGKTTILGSHHGVDESQYLTINPDVIKAEMARRGLVPEVKGLSPMEATDLVHEESSRVAKRLAHRAYADRKNVIWDITMSSGHSTGTRIEALRNAGYAQIQGVFVDVPVDVSAKRADARYRKDHEAYHAGQGLGGRYIPPEVVLSQANDVWGSNNRANFEQVKDRFDTWSRYDNSVDGRPPVLVEVGGRGMDDEMRART